MLFFVFSGCLHSCCQFVVFVHVIPKLRGRFPFLPESLRAVAKKVTGATAPCVSQPAMLIKPRPSEAATARETISVRARLQFSQSADRREAGPQEGSSLSTTMSVNMMAASLRSSG